MSKRRLKTILDLCRNNVKTNTNVQSNINHGNQTFNDFLSAAEFVFEDFDTDLANLGNVNVVENESNNIIFYEDPQQHNVEFESKNIVQNSLEISLIDNSLVVCNENLQNYSLNVEDFELNDLNLIVEDSEENILNCEKRHNIIPQPDKWKRETTKRLRMNGEEYIGYERNKSVVSHNVLRPPRNIQPTCLSLYCKKAKNRFCNTFDETQRLEIFVTFWKATWEEKKTLACSLVNKIKAKRSTKGNSDDSRRENTYEYNLKYKDFPPVTVCKKMFLATLGLNECMLHNWIRESTNGLPKNSKHSLDKTVNEISSQSLARKSALHTRVEHFNNWLKILPKMPSHYCRQRSKRLYLEGPFFSFQEIYECYTKKCNEDELKPFSKCYFNNQMKVNKISIFSPRKDQCDFCSSYEMNQISEDDYAVHLAYKESAREEKQLDKSRAQKNEVYCFTMDMQAVKLCPSLKASSLYYSMKLKCHNFTIYNLATNDCYNYWWHEGEGDLEASVFATILIKHLTAVCVENIPIIIYSDGCGYQNRNIIMSNALLQFSKHQNVTIEQKFLIKGHTQMECDSTHSMIERKLRNKDIFLPSDYIRITTEARKYPNAYKAVLLKHDYFYDFKSLKEYTSIRPGVSKGEPEVKDIRALLYDPSAFKIYYKLLFSEPYCEIPRKIIRKKNYQNLSNKIEGEFQFQKLYKSSLPLTKSKWNDLQKLKQFMPIDTHSFYDTLPHLNTFKTKAAKI